MKRNLLISLLASVTSVVALVGLLSPPHVTEAAVCTWTGTVDTDWANAGNWSGCGSVTPTLTDYVVINTTANQPIIDSGTHPSTRAAPTVTNVRGNITTNTTWSLINSPYDVCAAGVTIGPTATLTIQPGVTVQFDNDGGNKLNVNYGGALIAIGTLTQPITFTGVVATPGSWGGISALATVTPSLIHLSYVTLDYGGVITGSTRAQPDAHKAVVA